jgi:hypothetical protein
MSQGGRGPEGANTILVMGILSLVVCAPLGIAAWIQGNTYMKRCKEIGVEPEGSAVAGRICGMIASILMLVILVLYCAIFGLAMVGAAAGG